MNITNLPVWRDYLAKNTNDYGTAIIEFAERWADLMEAAMATGETLEACADRTGEQADAERITGFMYNGAVRVLVQVWQHGERLRRWHNLAVQIRGEGDQANRDGTLLDSSMMVRTGER